MSWAYGIVDGREVGYSVIACCEHPGCNKEIDRGLSYACGGDPWGGQNGCGHFFCSEHLAWVDGPDDERNGSGLCPECVKSYHKEHPEFNEESE